MVYNYEEIILKFKNDYQLKKAIEQRKIFKIESGIYSDYEYLDYLLIISKKYPNAIFTLDSAFYYHNLTDVIPQYYYLATHRKSAKINDKKIKQIYVSGDLFNLGVSHIVINGVEIKIYDKERLLIDLIKNSDKIPFDYYKEIINNYREISNKLDINKISDYLCYYKHDLDLFIQIQKEVF